MNQLNRVWAPVGITLAVLVLLAAGDLGQAEAGAQKESGGALGKQVRADLETLFTHCQADDFAKAAGYIVYRGPDKARRWRDVCDMSKEMERHHVERLCGRIKGDLAKSKGRTYLGFETERESEGTWHIWQVRFDGAAPQERMFALLKVKGHFALADID